MNPMQEAEFHLSVYHYFVWKAEQAQQQTGAASLEPPPPGSEEGNKKPAAKGGSPSKSKSPSPAAKNKQDENYPGVKYEAMAQAMIKHFPQHLSHFKNNQALRTQMPPVISSLYLDFPALQTQNLSARTRIAQLEALVENYKSEVQDSNKKRAAAEEAVTSPSKRAKKSSSPAEDINKSMKISARDDIPEDVKKLIQELRANAIKQKSAGKKRVERLEARIAKERQEKKEVAKKAAKIAVETVTRMNPQALATQKAATTAVVAAAKPKAPPVPSPWKSSATFEERVEELKHFYKGNGHCRVPIRQAGLGRWVAEMRQQYRLVQAGTPSPYLNPERIEMLSKMGFVWTVVREMVPWETRFFELKDYKAKFGHCNVPRTSYKENPSLGEWVHMQRKLYRQKAPIMMGDRFEKLKEIGFQWNTDMKKPTFDERLEECREFRRENGHLDVPLPAKYSKDDQSEYENKDVRSFYQWAQRQRDDYRKFQEGLKSSLDKVRIRKLDQLGFVWEPKSRAQVGGPGRPREYGPGKPRNEDRFDERVAQLRAIKEKYGDCNDLKTLKMAGYNESSSLYQWIKAQRKQYKSLKSGQWSSLSEERLAKLATIEFNFEPRKHYAAYGTKKAASASVEEPQGDNVNEEAMRAVVDEATEQLDDAGSGEDKTGKEQSRAPAGYPSSYRI